MMLKLHEWSHEIWSENVIFKCKNYVPHILFHVQIVVFRNSFVRHFNKALIFKKYISYTPILDSSSVMTLIMYILRSIGADPGFQVRGTHLKKLRRAKGGAKILVWKIKILAKKSYFLQF
jgi:hypothetical protein